MQFFVSAFPVLLAAPAPAAPPAPVRMMNRSLGLDPRGREPTAPKLASSVTSPAGRSPSSGIRNGRGKWRPAPRCRASGSVRLPRMGRRARPPVGARQSARDGGPARRRRRGGSVAPHRADRRSAPGGSLGGGQGMGPEPLARGEVSGRPRPRQGGPRPPRRVAARGRACGLGQHGRAHRRRRSTPRRGTPTAAGSCAAPTARRPASSSTTRCISCQGHARVDAGGLRAMDPRRDRGLRPVGLTEVQDASDYGPAKIASLEKLAAAGLLPIRIYATVSNDAKDLARLLRSRPAHRAGERFPDRAGDQGLRRRRARQPRRRAARGLLGRSRESGPARDLARTASPRSPRAARRHGWQVWIHAIGDRGNRVALDAFAKARGRAARRAAGARPRIEHAQVDAPRRTSRGSARLGVIASMQPTHATSDMPWAEERVGAARIEGAYAWRN